MKGRGGGLWWFERRRARGTGGRIYSLGPRARGSKVSHGERRWGKKEKEPRAASNWVGKREGAGRGKMNDDADLYFFSDALETGSFSTFLIALSLVTDFPLGLIEAASIKLESEKDRIVRTSPFHLNAFLLPSFPPSFLSSSSPLPLFFSLLFFFTMVPPPLVPSKTTQSLPVELFPTLFSFCSPSTLAAWCSTSISVLKLAGPVLYSTVVIREPEDYLLLFRESVSFVLLLYTAGGHSKGRGEEGGARARG